MDSSNGFVRFLKAIWRGMDGVRKVLHLLLLLILFLVVFGALSGAPVSTPKSAALLLQPVGALVEQLDGDPYDRALAEIVGEAPPQTLVQDVVDALAFAKDDKRITAVHLELSALAGGSLSKLQRIATAISDFRSSGKPVLASADYYSQQSYYLAAHANELYMHPEGVVFLQGYNSFRSYYKEALDKLRVDWNVFRVGTHKSYAEPYTRMDMSEEDRESRSRLVNQFWSMYQHEVELARGLPEGAVNDFAQNLIEHIESSDGDFAVAALEHGLVDKLLDRTELRDILIGYAGEDASDSSTYAVIQSQDYVEQMQLLHGPKKESQNVAVVVAAGTIVDGTQPPGVVGGDSTADLLRAARTDDAVAAVVLRVDSPGGSVFASEIIANEVLALQEAGKPVVASMGGVAASGGYWIAVVADKIYANPSTVTGSIGVFGMFPTYQRSLEALGVATDGVATTPWGGQLRPDREMAEPTKQLFQLMISDTYQDFISGVADLRQMNEQDVDAVGQGQVWTGQDALENGLIDALGTFEEAIAAAADLAGLEEGGYGTVLIEPRLSPTEQAVLDFLALSGRAGVEFSNLMKRPSGLRVLTNQLDKLLGEIARFNDPKGVYSHCFCEIN